MLRYEPLRLTAFGVTLVLSGALIGPQVTAAQATQARPQPALPQVAAATAFTDLGTLASLGGSGPFAVSDNDTVAFETGIWRGGVYTVAPHVPGSTTFAGAALNAMNASGLAVGAAGYLDGAGGHAVYWDTSTVAGPTFYPTFTDLNVNPDGCTHGSDALDAVDAAGEAAGVGTYHAPAATARA